MQENGLKGHKFTSLEEQNRHLLNWETNVADTRIHGTLKRQVGQLFREVERAALLPLPLERFPFFHEKQRKVSRDGHIEVAKAYYSVPPEYLGREVWVRWDARLVRVFNHRFQQIALHVRHDPGLELRSDFAKMAGGRMRKRSGIGDGKVSPPPFGICVKPVLHCDHWRQWDASSFAHYRPAVGRANTCDVPARQRRGVIPWLAP